VTPEALLLAEVRAQFAGQPITYGIDAKGPYARIGEVEARGRPDCEAALRAALQKARA
jgi:hypothetical protein